MTGAYDLVIIGGGSAGLTAAGFAVQLGARTALVERDRVGGDCTWTGCIPSKTLLKAARVAHQMRTAGSYGLTSVQPTVDLKQVMGHVREVVGEVYRHESPEVLRAQGIDVFLDNARFLDPHTLAVGKATLTARRVLLATGADPFIPPVDGLDGVDYLTYQSIWSMDVLPRHLMVMGAGPIGCEMTQAFRRLGAGVTLVDGAARMLSRDEPDASQVLADRFVQEGIDLRLNTQVERTWQDRDGIHLAAPGEELVGDSGALLISYS